jgi:hypothetical protein
MGEFGWAYISDAVSGQGPEGAVQYTSGSEGLITGSNNFVYNNNTSVLSLTGSMIISGTLQAHTFDVIHTNKVELQASGSSNFGNDSDDIHVFTGSVAIISGSFSRHYYKLLSNSYTVNSYDAIIGVSASGYVSITMPAADSMRPGTQIIIKDEFDITRVKASSTHIALSGSGGDTIDHQSTYSLEGDHVAVSLYCDGIDKWFIY